MEQTTDTHERQDSTKKKVLLGIALVALVALAAAGGVLAWITAQDVKTNTFVIGEGLVTPGELPDGSINTASTYIVEPSWDDSKEHSITAGSEAPKDPMIGLDDTSQSPAYVFAYIDNNICEDVYFELSDEWAPIDGCVQAYTSTVDNRGESYNPTAYRAYTEGLFVWLGGSGNANTPYTLDPIAKYATSSIYTDPVFSSIKCKAGSTLLPESGECSVDVNAFLVGRTSSEEYMDYSTAKSLAISWAAGFTD